MQFYVKPQWKTTYSMYVTYIERCRRNVRSMWFNVHWKTLYTQEEIWALRSPQHCCWGRATVQYKRTNDPTNERTNIYVYNFIGFYSANEHNQLITFAFFSCVVIAFSANWSLSHTVSLTFETIYYHGEKHTDWNQKKKQSVFLSSLLILDRVCVYVCVCFVRSTLAFGECMTKLSRIISENYSSTCRFPHVCLSHFILIWLRTWYDAPWDLI